MRLAIGILIGLILGAAIATAGKPTVEVLHQPLHRVCMDVPGCYCIPNTAPAAPPPRPEEE